MNQRNLKLFFILSFGHSDAVELRVFERKVPGLMPKDLFSMMVDDLLILQR